MKINGINVIGAVTIVAGGIAAGCTAVAAEDLAEEYLPTNTNEFARKVEIGLIKTMAAIAATTVVYKAMERLVIVGSMIAYKK